MLHTLLLFFFRSIENRPNFKRRGVSNLFFKNPNIDLGNDDNQDDNNNDNGCGNNNGDVHDSTDDGNNNHEGDNVTTTMYFHKIVNL